MSGTSEGPPRLPVVYLWEDIRIESCAPGSATPGQTCERHVLIAVREGTGLLDAGGKEYALEFGKCFVVHPGSELRLLNSSDDYPLSVYVLSFFPLDLDGSGHTAGPKLGEGAWKIVPFARMLELIRTLYEKKEEKEGAEPYGLHLLFQEIVYLVLQSGAKEPSDDSLRAVRRTIEFIEDSYSLDLTLAQLAEMADMSERHYSRLFQKLTGRSPIEYLIERRLNRAKQLLLTSGDSIQEIAASTGFRDPFHFSRSFKRHTSVSPRVYVRLRKQDIRIVSMHYLGELLALGVKPVGAPQLLLDGSFLKNWTAGIAAVGPSVVHPDLARIAAARPDAILTFDGHHYEDYARIAPTLSVPWFMPYFERFQRIAAWIGKAREAETWIAQYQEQVAATRSGNARRFPANAAFSFFWMRGLPNAFQVYYDMTVLYRDLQLPAPEPVARIQRQEGHPFKEDIPIEELARYAGDYLFVVVSPDDESRREMDLLERKAVWRDLEAVRNNRYFRLDTSWLMTDPLSLAGQLADFTRMLDAGRGPAD
ncbi:helix-turn-helix domain-containing protein [Cohnella cellulosilytica]|uniref:Helix-turn-helix domain-containing protein n=1 Tax=Cohnella cellulosilytica TaxID=986710 RepID=A0ABW2FCW7_9BACL